MADLARLEDLETVEVSLVRRGANMKRIALTKGKDMDEILKAALETECEEEEQLEGLTEEQSEAAKLVLRAAKAYDLPEEAREQLSKLLWEAPEDVEVDEEDELEVAPEVAEKLALLTKAAEDARAAQEELQKSLTVETEKRELVELEKKCEKELSCIPGSFVDTAVLLRKARQAGIGEDLEALLGKVNAQLDQSEILKTRGSTVSGEGSARKELEVKIKDLRMDTPSLTYQMAFAHIHKADPELWARVQEEER